jgi:hypothetical protein
MPIPLSGGFLRKMNLLEIQQNKLTSIKLLLKYQHVWGWRWGWGYMPHREDIHRLAVGLCISKRKTSFPLPGIWVKGGTPLAVLLVWSYFNALSR